MQNIPECLKDFTKGETDPFGFTEFALNGCVVMLSLESGIGFTNALKPKGCCQSDFNSIAELEALLAPPHDQFIEWVKSTVHFPQLLHTHGDRLFIRETGGMFKVQAIQLAWEAYNAKT